MSPVGVIRPVGPTKGHPDRQGLPVWLVTALVLSCAAVGGIAGQLGARNRVTPTTGLLVGVGVAVLALLGLPSLSIRLTARLIVATSGIVLARFGVLTGSLASSGQSLVVWLVAVVAIFVLTDRIGTGGNVPLDPEHRRVRSPVPTARRIVAISVVIVLIALFLAPWVAPRIGSVARAGQGPVLGPSASGALRSSETLDMTRRPALTDEVVMTVESNRATFLRGETFDNWDGRTWSRTQRTISRLADGDTVTHRPDDLGAAGDDVVRQRVRIESDFANVLYAVSTATSVEAPEVVVQRPDSTMLVAPLGRGATYSVTSRRFALTPELLRRTGEDVPEAILEQYATRPDTTERVRTAALRVTRGATNTFDKIIALQDWMGDRAEYSLDAPLAPEGVDVVDHFLFDSKQGWCEQIASSLVVLARANGIPARLVTGYVMTEQDPVTGRFIVRAKYAHAWAEVWFPEVGWVPFDPTADVGLAGNDRAQDTWAHWLATHWVYLVLGAAVIGVLVGPVRLLLKRLRRRRADRPRRWAAELEAHLDKLGKKVDRPRDPAETAGAYAAALARIYGDDRLVTVGLVVDQGIYAPSPPTSAQQAEADSIVAEIAARGAPDKEPDPPEPTEPSASELVDA